MTCNVSLNILPTFGYNPHRCCVYILRTLLEYISRAFFSFREIYEMAVILWVILYVYIRVFRNDIFWITSSLTMTTPQPIKTISIFLVTLSVYLWLASVWCVTKYDTMPSRTICGCQSCFRNIDWCITSVYHGEWWYTM